MKRKEFNITLAPEKAMTARYALKKSVCHTLVKLAKESKATETTVYFIDENGLEWCNADIQKVSDTRINRCYYTLSFEYFTDETDVATTYSIDVYRGKLDKELSDYEVNRY